MDETNKSQKEAKEILVTPPKRRENWKTPSIWLAMVYETTELL